MGGSDIAAGVVFLGLVGMFITLPPYFYELYAVLKSLRNDHEYEWRRLGSPTLFLNNSILNNLRFRKFLKKKNYLELKDDLLSKRCERVQRYKMFYLVCFGFVAFAMIYFFVSGGPDGKGV